MCVCVRMAEFMYVSHCVSVHVFSCVSVGEFKVFAWLYLFLCVFVCVVGWVGECVSFVNG